MNYSQKKLLQNEILYLISQDLKLCLNQVRDSVSSSYGKDGDTDNVADALRVAIYILTITVHWARRVYKDRPVVSQVFIVRLQLDLILLSVKGAYPAADRLPVKNLAKDLSVRADLQLLEFVMKYLLVSELARLKPDSCIDIDAALSNGELVISLSGILKPAGFLFCQIPDARHPEGTRGSTFGHCSKLLKCFGGRLWTKEGPGAGFCIFFSIPTSQ